MKFEVFGNRVLVDPWDNEVISPGGVFLPDSLKAKTIKGMVVGVGKGRVTETGALIEPVTKVGEVVLLSKAAYSAEVVLGDKTYLIVRDEDILGRFK